MEIILGILGVIVLALVSVTALELKELIKEILNGDEEE